MNEIKLEKDGIYRVHHERKGVFVARLLDVVPADEGDEYDKQYLHMMYDVRAGTDQVGLAIVPGKDQFRESNLRPSLILKIEPVPEGEDWLREVKLPEPKAEKKGLFDRIRGH